MAHSDIEPQISHFTHGLPTLEPIPPFDVLGLIKAVWRGKWIIVFTTMLCITIAGYYAFRVAQPKFQATASVAQMVVSQDTTLVQSQAIDDEIAFNTALASLTSRDLLAQVISELNLLSDSEFNRHLNPQSTYSVTTLRRQLRHFLAGTTDLAPTKVEIFEKTIENLSRAIVTRRQGDTYIAQITVQSGSAQKATLIANTLAQTYLNNQHDASLRSQVSTSTWLAEKVATLRLQLVAQETQISDLISAAQVQDDASLDALSRQVLTAEQNLAEAQSAIDAITGAQNTDTPRATATLAQKRVEHSAITVELDRLRAQLAAQSAGLATLQQFQIEAEATKAVYTSYLTRLKEQDQILPAATAITPAVRGYYIGPQKVLILTVATAFGLLLGLFAVALRQTFRRGICDASALRHATGQPIFAQFSNRLPTSSRGLKRLCDDDQPMAIKETLKGLCASLIMSSQGQIPQVILSTSSTPGEGKGHPALLLADCLGRTGKSVLFIAADQTDPITSKLCSENLETKADNSDLQIIKNEMLQADILLTWANSSSMNVHTSSELESNMTDLRARYDHIIIDAPPVTSTPEACIWAAHAVTIIYSVSCGRTSICVINRGLRALKGTDTPIAGLIFTQINSHRLRNSGQGNFIAPATTAPQM